MNGDNFEEFCIKNLLSVRTLCSSSSSVRFCNVAYFHTPGAFGYTLRALDSRVGVLQQSLSCLSMLRPHRETLNQFRPSVPVWSEPLWPTFVTHVGISAQLILRIFTSYSYDEFGQLKKSINYTLSSGKLNGLRKKSPRLPSPDINFKIAVTWFTKVNNQQYPHQRHINLNHPLSIHYIHNPIIKTH